VSTDNRLGSATRELWSLISLWLGLGVDHDRGPSVHRGASFLAVQTAVAVALAAALSLGKAAVLNGGDLSRGWLFGLFVPVLPLVAGIARTPPGLAVALGAALPAGLLAGGVTGLVLGAADGGFWRWFATVTVAALVAGPVFGALARDRSG
jgi:hypothetical protein